MTGDERDDSHPAGPSAPDDNSQAVEAAPSDTLSIDAPMAVTDGYSQAAPSVSDDTSKAAPTIPDSPSKDAPTVPNYHSQADLTVPNSSSKAAPVVPDDNSSKDAPSVPDIPSKAAPSVPDIPSKAAPSVPDSPSKAAPSAPDDNSSKDTLTVPDSPSKAAPVVPDDNSSKDTPTVLDSSSKDATTVPNNPSKAAPVVPDDSSKDASTVPDSPSKDIPTVPNSPSKSTPLISNIPSISTPTVPDNSSQDVLTVPNGPSKAVPTARNVPSKAVPKATNGPSKAVPKARNGPSKPAPKARQNYRTKRIHLQKERIADLPSKFYNSDIPDFGEYLLSEKFTDVYLVCKNHKIAAHRARLSSVSPLLASIFSVDTSEVSVVIVPDVSFSTLRLLINFIYTGFMRATRKEVQDILEAGHILGINKAIDVEHDNFNQRTRKRPVVETESPKDTQKKMKISKPLRSTVNIVEAGDNIHGMVVEEQPVEDAPDKLPLKTPIASRNEQVGKKPISRHQQQSNSGKTTRQPQVRQKIPVRLLEKERNLMPPPPPRVAKTKRHPYVRSNSSKVPEVIILDEEEPMDHSSNIKVSDSPILNPVSENSQVGLRTSPENNSNLISCAEENQNKEPNKQQQEKIDQTEAQNLTKTIGQVKSQTLPVQKLIQNAPIQVQSPEKQQKEILLSSPLKSNKSEESLKVLSKDSMKLSKQVTPNLNLGVHSTPLTVLSGSKQISSKTQVKTSQVMEKESLTACSSAADQNLLKRSSEISDKQPPQAQNSESQEIVLKTSPTVLESVKLSQPMDKGLIEADSSVLEKTPSTKPSEIVPQIQQTVLKAPSALVATSNPSQLMYKKPTESSVLTQTVLKSQPTVSQNVKISQSIDKGSTQAVLKQTVVATPPTAQSQPLVKAPPSTLTQAGSSGMQQTVQKISSVVIGAPKPSTESSKTDQKKAPIFVTQTKLLQLLNKERPKKVAVEISSAVTTTSSCLTTAKPSQVTSTGSPKVDTSIMKPVTQSAETTKLMDNTAQKTTGEPSQVTIPIQKSTLSAPPNPVVKHTVPNPQQLVMKKMMLPAILRSKMASSMSATKSMDPKQDTPLGAQSLSIPRSQTTSGLMNPAMSQTSAKQTPVAAQNLPLPPTPPSQQLTQTSGLINPAMSQTPQIQQSMGKGATQIVLKQTAVKVNSAKPSQTPPSAKLNPAAPQKLTLPATPRPQVTQTSRFANPSMSQTPPSANLSPWAPQRMPLLPTPRPQVSPTSRFMSPSMSQTSPSAKMSPMVPQKLATPGTPRPQVSPTSRFMSPSMSQTSPSAKMSPMVPQKLATPGTSRPQVSPTSRFMSPSMSQTSPSAKMSPMVPQKLATPGTSRPQVSPTSRFMSPSMSQTSPSAKISPMVPQKLATPGTPRPQVSPTSRFVNPSMSQTSPSTNVSPWAPQKSATLGTPRPQVSPTSRFVNPSMSQTSPSAKMSPMVPQKLATPGTPRPQVSPTSRFVNPSMSQTSPSTNVSPWAPQRPSLLPTPQLKVVDSSKLMNPVAPGFSQTVPTNPIRSVPPPTLTMKRPLEEESQSPLTQSSPASRQPSTITSRPPTRPLSRVAQEWEYQAAKKRKMNPVSQSPAQKLLQQTVTGSTPPSTSPAPQPSGIMSTVQQAVAGLLQWKTQRKSSVPSPQPITEEEKKRIEEAVCQTMSQNEVKKEANPQDNKY